MAEAPGEEGPRPERIVVLGRVAGTFGVQGWLKVQSYTSPPDNVLNYAVWQVGTAGRWQALELEAGRVTAKGVLAKLAGLETPEAARLHVGAQIGVPRHELPPAAPGEYYWSDLEGLEAWSGEGERLGLVDHFRSTPGGTLIVVRGTREHWIPFVKDRIVAVDLEAGRIVLDWSEEW